MLAFGSCKVEDSMILIYDANLFLWSSCAVRALEFLGSLKSKVGSISDVTLWLKCEVSWASQIRSETTWNKQKLVKNHLIKMLAFIQQKMNYEPK